VSLKCVINYNFYLSLGTDGNIESELWQFCAERDAVWKRPQRPCHVSWPLDNHRCVASSDGLWAFLLVLRSQRIMFFFGGGAVEFRCQPNFSKLEHTNFYLFSLFSIRDYFFWHCVRFIIIFLLRMQGIRGSCAGYYLDGIFVVPHGTSKLSARSILSQASPRAFVSAN